MTGTQEYLKVATDLIQDFRKRIFLITVILFAGTIFGYYQSNIAMNYLFNRVNVVIFISPTEGFVTKLKISLILGVILTMPLILFIILNFLKKRLRNFSMRDTLILTLISYILFLIGAAFAVFVILPLGLTFLLGFATPDLEPMLSAGHYVSFATVLLLAFGITFELPLIITLLTHSGILNSKILREKRKYVILLMFTVAGFLTPPDVVSQVLMAVPLLGLYELSIILASIREKKKSVQEKEAEEAEDDGIDKEVVEELMKQMF